MAKKKKGQISRFFRMLGPGFITGASDDDPSGIGTYSQAGAQLGFNIGWTLILTFPLMAAIQEISARIGRTTGHGIAGNLRRHYPRWILYIIVAFLFTANAVNIGADLSAMGEAVALLIGGNQTLFVIGFGAICTVMIVFVAYTKYVSILKWTTLSLFAYVVGLFSIDIPWKDALTGLFFPHVAWSSAFLTTLLAILGTTISPYLFFWQASQEVEAEKADNAARPLVVAPNQATPAFARIRADTLVGMAFSNLIAIAIVMTAAATLHKAGTTNIGSSAQAAEALKPVAGNIAFALFALGIVGTGLLAVPVLAGSAAYAIGEAFRWSVGLSRKPREAIAFYIALSTATLTGIAITLTPIDPMKALYWSAVINGVIAVPVMVIMMLLAGRQDVMGKFTIRGPLRFLGWLSTCAMAASACGMGLTWLL